MRSRTTIAVLGLLCMVGLVSQGASLQYYNTGSGDLVTGAGGPVWPVGGATWKVQAFVDNGNGFFDLADTTYGTGDVIIDLDGDGSNGLQGLYGVGFGPNADPLGVNIWVVVFDKATVPAGGTYWYLVLGAANQMPYFLSGAGNVSQDFGGESGPGNWTFVPEPGTMMLL